MTIEKIIQSNELPLSRKLIINLLITSNRLQEVITESLKPFDITLQQFNVLRILRGQKGKPANLSTIQDRMVAKMSNTTRLVDKLISKKYVHRIVCPTNRRKVEISITQEGLDFLQKIDPIITTAEEKLVSALTQKECEQLSNLLNTIRP